MLDELNDADMEMNIAEADNSPARIVKSIVKEPGENVIFELFSPPRVGPHGARFGLRATAIDLETGFDLMKYADRERVINLWNAIRPQILQCSTPCTWFSSLNVMWNHKKLSQEEWQRKEDEAMTLLDFSAELCNQQDQADVRFRTLI